jgi:hypothetical protein
MLLEISITDGQCGIFRDYKDGSKVNIENVEVDIEYIFKTVENI